MLGRRDPPGGPHGVWRGHGQGPRTAGGSPGLAVTRSTNRDRQWAALGSNMVATVGLGGEEAASRWWNGGSGMRAKRKPHG
jgi:hypothetical protein